ncbi:MAG: methionyl-tRNA formyltransferase [Bacilli bacterium]|nr:methionyl-tRNA formyltransferase [Bacilli bacterium]
MHNKKDYRLIYMGTPEISAMTFESLIKSGWNFVALISQTDKEVGRKHQLVDTPTKVIAKKYQIPIYQPKKIREEYEFVKDLKPDLILTFAYGQIIPQGLLDIPKYGCLNLHGSLLPKYRGAAPIQRAIINGEKETGITLMEMIDKMDAGRMYATHKVKIDESDNYTSLSNKLAKAASEIVDNYLLKYLNGDLLGKTQDEKQVTFANKITSEEEHLNINLRAIEQINYIRALANTPGAYLYIGNEKIKIYDAKVYDDTNKYQLGEIVLIDKRLFYQAKDGLIELISIQPQGKNKMFVRDYLNGHQDIVGQILK